jgi:hypothetical protein
MRLRAKLRSASSSINSANDALPGSLNDAAQNPKSAEQTQREYLPSILFPIVIVSPVAHKSLQNSAGEGPVYFRSIGDKLFPCVLYILTVLLADVKHI